MLVYKRITCPYNRARHDVSYTRNVKRNDMKNTEVPCFINSLYLVFILSHIKSISFSWEILSPFKEIYFVSVDITKRTHSQLLRYCGKRRYKHAYIYGEMGGYRYIRSLNKSDMLPSWMLCFQ